MSAYDLIYDINRTVREHVESNMQSVRPEQLGLDNRAGYELFVDEDTIVSANGTTRLLDYYGGFEYVDSDCRTVVGDYTFYSAEDDRVREHLDRFYDRATDEHEEEEAA